MRIVDFRIHSIAIADPPLRSSYGLHAPYALRTILEIESDEGGVGISETHGGETIARQFADLRPRIVGADPFRLTAALMPLVDPTSSAKGDRSQTLLVPGENPMDAATRLYSAVEIACLDLIGKSIGRPVCDLLGGRVRSEVPFSAYLFYKHAGGGGEADDVREDEYGEALDPDAIVRQARQMMHGYGFTSVKLKGGVLEPEAEIDSIRELRRALGSAAPLRIDPNCAWSVGRSIEIGAALAAELSGEGYLEDPTSGLDGMAAVRGGLIARGVQIPLASNVAVTSLADLPGTIERDAVQIVLCDPHYWGGLRQIQHLAQVCQTFGLGLSMHSNSHLGVSLMAMAHAAAVAPRLTYACDTHYPWQHEADEVVQGGRIPIRNGCVAVGDKPGLGIELDQDQLARGKERYRRCAYRKRDDEAEMRKHVDPAWSRVLPRW
ncbi:MAG: glucarate dehydratase [Luteitalea sp.]|nr:glucarate dehydratase [Luteitalea sp.]